jgi:imidazolonepropionase-like amidohydrolase
MAADMFRLARVTIPILAVSLCFADTRIVAQQRAGQPAAAPTGQAPPNPAPNRRPGEGLGPFNTLLISGVTLIDGTGAPPTGPVDVIVSGNRITSVRSAGVPGLPSNTTRRPAADHVIDGRGMYLLPGFVDMHGHAGGPPKSPDAEYAFKLWLAHGVTTVRGVPLASHAFVVREKERSARNEIVAPRIYNYQRPGAGWDQGPVDSPAKATAWVEWASRNGVDGLKLGADRPEIMKALLEAAKARGLGSTAHLQQSGVAQMNALDAARLGLGTVTHFYGHFEALLKDHVVQPWPVDINAADEQWRFAQAARLWDKIHPPDSPEWKAYLMEHLRLGTVFEPTLTIYSASRDVMRARTAEWHDKYTLPSLMDYFTPNRANHGSYWFYWTTEDEIEWRRFYQVWFRLVNDYKKLGGRITTGSDPGFIYSTFGFGYINEFEMLQEAGLHPLEVIQAATMNGALTLSEPKGTAPEFGIVRAGMLADLVLVGENPLKNFKVLYGTGAVKLNDATQKVERVGGVRYTIKDGIVYDARKLLEDVAAMVERQKRQRATSPTPAGH